VNVLNRSALVPSDDWGIDGLNYYWKNRARFGITEEELATVGVTNGRTYIRLALVEPLLQVIQWLQTRGYTIRIEDGYRSEATYELAHRKLAALNGKDFVDSRFNMVDKPHTSGRAVDLALIDIATGLQINLRDDRHGPGAAFVGFYQGKTDPESIEYQRRQALLVGYMLHAGFVLGSRRECWHFELPA
jgi:D-alanyl-D-alanine dipeptidase